MYCIPYTITVALLDVTDPASLLTIHLYMYCPTVMLLLVVYDALLATVVHLLPDLLSQEYISVPSPSALHVTVVVLLNGMTTSLGCVVIDGGPEKLYSKFNPHENLSCTSTRKFTTIELEYRREARTEN